MEGAQFPEYYNSKSVLRLSVAHVIVASLHIIFGIASIPTVPFITSIIAFPVWGGVVVAVYKLKVQYDFIVNISFVLFLLNVCFCVAGGLGIGSYKNKSMAVIGTFLGFSCFSILIATIMFIAYIFAFSYFDSNYYIPGHWWSSGHWLFPRSVEYVGKGMTSAVFLLVLLELAISIASTVYASQAFCQCCRCCVVGEDRYCSCLTACEEECCGSGECNCDCNRTPEYDRYSEPYIVPLRGPGGAVGFSNRSYMPNAAPLVNIYINVPGETPMPNTSTDSGAIQINIQDMRKRQQPETQGAQFSQAVVQPTQPQGLSTAPPGYNQPLYGYEAKSDNQPPIV